MVIPSYGAIVDRERAATVVDAGATAVAGHFERAGPGVIAANY